MRKIRWTVGVPAWLVAATLLGAQLVRTRPVRLDGAKEIERFRDSWRVLEPITRRNLSVYPLVSNLKVDTSEFLTLDEGVAKGVVQIVERGQVEGRIYRRRIPVRGPWEERPIPPFNGASVNELVLINQSSRPLILLAGEVVSGGKQNRIIGADLIVPPKSDPLPLSVFCVEHGRWSAGSGFDSAKAIAHPTIRREAQVNKSQAGVWESVRSSAGALRAPSPTSDYLQVLSSPEAKRSFDEVATSIEADYERELREQVGGRGAVGVVVAINGEIVWSDVFSSRDLFSHYWPKLLRSYVVEAQSRAGEGKFVPSSKEAMAFLLEDRGRASIQTEPGAYRRTEINSERYEIVALEALEKGEEAGLLVHYNKMSRE